MYCPRCRTQVDNGKKFCDECGSRLLDNYNIESNIIIETSTNSTVVDNISMVESFVGPSYEKLRRIGFNIWFFLFGPYYMLYRKMYVYGFIYLLLMAFIFIFLTDIFFIVGIVNVLVSFKFNNIYLSYVSRKVESVRTLCADQNNRSEVLKKCSEQGGCNIAVVLLGMAAYGYLTFNKTQEITNQFLADRGLLPSSTKSAMNYKKLSFQNPNGVTKEVTSSAETVYTYSDEDNSCNYTVIVTETNTTAQNYLNRKSEYTGKDTKNPIISETFNGKQWKLLKVNKSNSVVYDYAILYKHYLYNVVFKEYKDSGKCSSIKDDLTSSLKLNK